MKSEPMPTWLAFEAQIAAGGAYEARTVGALSLRALFRIAVAPVTLRAAEVTAAGSSTR